MEAKTPQQKFKEYMDEHIPLNPEKELNISSPLIRGKMNRQDETILKSTWKVYMASKIKEKEGKA